MAAHACDLNGSITCTNGLTFPNVVINVTGTNCNGAYSNSTITDSNGVYLLILPDCTGTYTATVDMSTLPSDAVISTASQTTFTISAPNAYSIYWSVDSSVCSQGHCWLTGGGAYSTDGDLKHPEISFGGNINPGCSPTAGNGGDWNHVDRTVNLHFHGTDIEVVDCGNVTPPPGPGSKSPKTPFNFIEFTGTGTLTGIGGNTADYGTVYFFGRFEDHHEPGNSHASSGPLVDRYYLRVYTDPTNPFGTTVLLLGGNDPDPANDTVPITDGNLQMHENPCP